MVNDSRGTITIWLYCVYFVFVLYVLPLCLNTLQTMWLVWYSVSVSKPWLLMLKHQPNPLYPILTFTISVLISTSWFHWFKKLSIVWLPSSVFRQLHFCGVVLNKWGRKLLSCRSCGVVASDNSSYKKRNCNLKL